MLCYDALYLNWTKYTLGNVTPLSGYISQILHFQIEVEWPLYINIPLALHFAFACFVFSFVFVLCSCFVLFTLVFFCKVMQVRECR